MSIERPTKNSDHEEKLDFKSGTSSDKIIYEAAWSYTVLIQNRFLSVIALFAVCGDPWGGGHFHIGPIRDVPTLRTPIFSENSRIGGSP